MPEIPFQLSTRQAIRVTVEFVVAGLLVHTGVSGAAKLGYYLAGATYVENNPWELISSPLACAWVVWRVQRRHRVAWPQLAVWRVRPAGLFAPFLVALIGSSLVLSGVDSAIETILPSPDWIRELMCELLNFANAPFATFTNAVALAALTEEAICRGIVLRGLLASTSPRRAIVVSSALFAAMHLNPWHIAGAFGGGLSLGWAYLRTRSLGLCVAGHAFHNALCIFAPSLPVDIPGFYALLLPGQAAALQPWWLNLIGLALLVAGVVWFNRAAPAARPFPAQTESTAPTHLDTASTEASRRA